MITFTLTYDLRNYSLKMSKTSDKILQYWYNSYYFILYSSIVEFSNIIKNIVDLEYDKEISIVFYLSPDENNQGVYLKRTQLLSLDSEPTELDEEVLDNILSLNFSYITS